MCCTAHDIADNTEDRGPDDHPFATEDIRKTSNEQEAYSRAEYPDRADPSEVW